MSSKQDFLIEIGTEELPPKSLWDLSQAFASILGELLTKNNFSYDKVEKFASPRRLAVIVKNLAATQPTQSITKRGPAVDMATDKNGKPSPQALGFAKSCGVAFEDLETIETDKGKWLSFNATVPGKALAEIFPEIFSSTIKRLPVAKRMRWADLQQEFVRPVHWLLALHGSEIIKFHHFNIESSNFTYGHRFLANKKIIINHPGEYLTSLEKAFVEVDFNQRKKSIAIGLEAAATALNAKVVLNEDLLQEVTSLVEWPTTMVAGFDPQFLQVPKEALISSMQNHQKCFAVVDNNNNLLPKFILISNMTAANSENIIHGNERVMRARLADAKFFYATDLKQTLASRTDKLKTITFHHKLGSVHDKVTRVSAIALQLAKSLQADAALVARAAELSKADLTTAMVGEFPELQGIMGYYYALNDKENEQVAIAIKEAYWPRFANDDIPTTTMGKILAIAERIDSIVAMFSIGLIPKGDKDPFALRRAALGIVRIIIESEIALDLAQIINVTTSQLAKAPQNIADDVLEFFNARIKFWYLDNNVKAEVIDAVLSQQITEPLDIHYRINAVLEFTKMPEAESLAAANKRVRNILSKSNINANNSIEINSDLLEPGAENDLAKAIVAAENQVMPLFEQRQYASGFKKLASLKNNVDAFFDSVMVMVDDEKIRTNRLHLLNRLQKLFLSVADVSRL